MNARTEFGINYATFMIRHIIAMSKLNGNIKCLKIPHQKYVSLWGDLL